MAERRMFAKTIIDSDAFMDMPVTARLLYYDLGMRADDDGFVNSPKKIMRMTGASQDDLTILALRKFIIPFDNGVVVIKHWRIHNYIRKDTYNATPYVDQMAMLELDENGAYRLRSVENKALPDYVDVPSTEPSRDCDEPVDGPRTQVRLGKVRLGKDRLDNNNMRGAMDASAPESSGYRLILNDKTYFDVPRSDVERWRGLYPAVDVDQALRSMIGWCDNNPTKRKTKAGIKRFINAWLAREQDRGGSRAKAPRGVTAKQDDELSNLFA